MNPPTHLLKKWNGRRQPQQNGRLFLSGLQQPVTIYRDQWGLATLVAQNRHDLLFTQGFVHAQDRLWQMDLNRRAAQGRLSELFGQLTLDTDRFARTLGFARLAAVTWQQLSDDTRRDFVAYSDGVNAYLNSHSPRPLEHLLLRVTPQPWQPLDSLAFARLQMWALTNSAVGTLIHAQLIERVGDEMAAELALNTPVPDAITLPHGTQINALRLDEMVQTAVAPFMGKGTLDGAGRGSNGWLVAPQRSSTGHAILANDMHLPVGTPSLWHVQTLHSADGVHVGGFTLPGLPHVIVGHNAHIAWGATMAYTDGEDLFIEQFDPENPHRYRTGDGWRDAQQIAETIAVRGAADHVETVTLTHHGPLIDSTLLAAQRPASTERIALASVALDPDVSMLGFALLNTARGWDEFVTAVAHIQSPALNLLYADQKGNIGHAVSGRVPIRPKGDGTLPSPGWTGAYDWQGHVPFDQMPQALNPPSGYIVSANNKIVPDDYPYFLGTMWRNGYRAQRIEQLLTGQTAVSPTDCARFQMDTYHLPGVVLVAQLAHMQPTDPLAAQTLALLRQWDGEMSRDSVGGAALQLFLTHLTEAIMRPHVDEAFSHRLLGLGTQPNMAPVNELQAQWLLSLLAMLQNPASRWLPHPYEALVVRCLHATAVSRQHLGLGITWGDLHPVTFNHALAARPPLDKVFSVGPWPVGGDSYTVLQTGTQPNDLYGNNAISVSTRLIVDLSDWDKTQLVFAPGQSGWLGSQHYDDLAGLWQNGRFIPLPWRENAVIEAAQHKLVLMCE